jgi:hypothetical protein
MNIEDAIACLKASGYRVTKARAARVETTPVLNAIGKPYGSNFDPNYRMKYKPRRYAPGGGSVNGISPQRWTAMCAEANEAWQKFMEGSV